MKSKVFLTLFAVILLVTASFAFAAEEFTDFTMYFSSTTSYEDIVADTTSKDMLVANNAYGRLYVTSTTSPVNNVYRAYYRGYITGQY